MAVGLERQAQRILATSQDVQHRGAAPVSLVARVEAFVADLRLVALEAIVHHPAGFRHLAQAATLIHLPRGSLDAPTEGISVVLSGRLELQREAALESQP